LTRRMEERNRRRRRRRRTRALERSPNGHAVRACEWSVCRPWYHGAASLASFLWQPLLLCRAAYLCHQLSFLCCARPCRGQLYPARDGGLYRLRGCGCASCSYAPPSHRVSADVSLAPSGTGVGLQTAIANENESESDVRAIGGANLVFCLVNGGAPAPIFADCGCGGAGGPASESAERGVRVCVTWTATRLCLAAACAWGQTHLQMLRHRHPQLKMTPPLRLLMKTRHQEPRLARGQRAHLPARARGPACQPC
jgi:hypothetical protein